jgi:hypothetical protein
MRSTAHQSVRVVPQMTWTGYGFLNLCREGIYHPHSSVYLYRLFESLSGHQFFGGRLDVCLDPGRVHIWWSQAVGRHLFYNPGLYGLANRSEHARIGEGGQRLRTWPTSVVSVSSRATRATGASSWLITIGSSSATPPPVTSTRVFVPFSIFSLPTPISSPIVCA